MNKSRASRPSRTVRWLVVSAWAPELDRLESGLRAWPPRVRARVALDSVGVGLVEAGIGTSHLLARQKPDALLLVGTAGVYPGHWRSLPLGAAAVARQMLLLPDLASGRSCTPALMSVRERCVPRLVQALVRATRLPVADVACPLAITADARAAALAAARSGSALENLEAFAVGPPERKEQCFSWFC